jgi:hypothetical protein
VHKLHQERQPKLTQLYAHIANLNRKWQLHTQSVVSEYKNTAAIIIVVVTIIFIRFQHRKVSVQLAKGFLTATEKQVRLKKPAS